MRTIQERLAQQEKDERKAIADIAGRMKALAEAGAQREVTKSAIRRDIRISMRQAPAYLSCDETQDALGEALEWLEWPQAFAHCKAVEDECEAQEREMALKIQRLEAEIGECRNMAMHASAIRSAHMIHRCLMKKKDSSRGK